jgi:exonuclease III
MSMLCWNCHGLGNLAIVHDMYDLLRMNPPSILCILETQISKQRVDGLASSLGFNVAFGVGSSGQSEGLCIFWKNPMQLTLRNSLNILLT